MVRYFLRAHRRVARFKKVDENRVRFPERPCFFGTLNASGTGGGSLVYAISSSDVKLAAAAGPFFSFGERAQLHPHLGRLRFFTGLPLDPTTDVEAQGSIMTAQYHQPSGMLRDPSLEGGGMPWQHHNDAVQTHQQKYEERSHYTQREVQQQQPPPSASPTCSAPGKHGWDVRKV